MFEPTQELIDVVMNFDEKILFSKVSVERIRDELCKILEKGNVNMFIKSGFIGKIIPEFKEFTNKPFEQHELDHICRVILNARESKDVGFMVAALFHDSGKAFKGSFTESKNRWQFIEHELKSVDIIKTNMERLKFSTKEIKRVEFIVRHHMFIKFEHKDLTTIKFILRNPSELIKDVIKFNRFDWMGKTPEEQIKLDVLNKQGKIEKLMEQWINAVETIKIHFSADLKAISEKISNNPKIPMNERGLHILTDKANFIKRKAAELHMIKI